MPFAIDPAHRQFFHASGWLQLTGALDEKQLSLLRFHLAGWVEKKRQAQGNPFELGRDLHLKESWARGFAFEIGSIAAGLWNERPLTLLGDQLLWKGWPLKGPAPSGGYSIDQIWSAQPILGAVALAVDPWMLGVRPSNDTQLQELPSGSFLCLKSQTQGFIPPPTGHLVWFWVFGTDQARYIKAPSDPFSDAYRQRGVADQGRIAQARPLVLSRSL